MAKRNRPSVLKRQREAEKRQRQTGKAAKAAIKRERRLEKKSGESEAAPSEDMPEIPEPLNLSAESNQRP